MNETMSRYGYCTNCGGELEYPKPHIVLSNPTQIVLICKNCGHREYKKLTQPIVEPVEKVEHRELLKRVAELEKKVAKLLGEEDGRNV